MFVKGIETAASFTRPIHTIARFYGNADIIPGAATLFFVNDDGWALTCKHVVSQLISTDKINKIYSAFKAARDQLPIGKKSRKALRVLERKHGYSNGGPIEIHHRFVNCIEGPLQLDFRLHATLDVALLKFNNFTKISPDTFAVFAQNSANLKQGKSLCRLGFPFPEFTNFEYDAAADQMRWTNTGRTDSPRFPIEGMVTRRIIGPSGVVGFELSTPGLRGQSGGPAFDTSGRVWGMQSATNHLDLDFDVDMEVLRNGTKRRVTESAILHVGHCIHIDVLKQFMRDNGVAFQEAD